MSERSSGVPDEVADAEVDQGARASEGGDEVDLDLDEDKLEKWDEVKSDYQIEPDGKALPNVWDAGEGDESHQVDPDADSSGNGMSEDDQTPEENQTN